MTRETDSAPLAIAHDSLSCRWQRNERDASAAWSSLALELVCKPRFSQLLVEKKKKKRKKVRGRLRSEWPASPKKESNRNHWFIYYIIASAHQLRLAMMSLHRGATPRVLGASRQPLPLPRSSPNHQYHTITSSHAQPLYRGHSFPARTTQFSSLQYQDRLNPAHPTKTTAKQEEEEEKRSIIIQKIIKK